ncbi:TetR/AcrR family transcriptional regulator [Phenylobacterium sp.]|uniref:TetR/AcrR family transcriptional regulator n=1 Tax=Phenylobacterium sp. TaxID=1871053 RepID=UPI0026000F63|nr:TetR/AcrR family transcriptional regulator [Phenylobacterium sp.]
MSAGAASRSAKTKADPTPRNPGVRRAGRPRDPNIDRLLLETTLSELIARGYAGMSVDKVAMRAGVGKPAVYRRYPDKESLAIAALGRLAAKTDVHLTGDLRADLTAEINEAHENLVRTNGVPLVGTLIAELNRHPELLNMYREQLVRPRSDKVELILRDAQSRGELRADANLPFITRLLFGLITGSYIVGEPLDRAAVAAAVDVILDSAIESKPSRR